VRAEPQTILVHCPNWVGDVVMATPMFDCLRENFPNARIVGVIRKYAVGIVSDGPWFDEIIGCDDKSQRGLFELVGKLRKLRPDVSFVLPNSFRAALIHRLAGAREIYGYQRNLRSLLLSDGPKPNYEGKVFIPRPMADYYLEICRYLKLDGPAPVVPSLFVSEKNRYEADELLKRYGVEKDAMVIGINPGASYGSSKCWPADYFAKLAELLTERWKCKVLLFAGPGEEEIARSIEEACRVPIINTSPDRVDLALLKPLIQRCQLLVTNDTGPRHYGVAFDVPAVVIMGPTDPRYTAANLDKTLVLRKELECSPCHKKVCPIDHRCMLDIKPEDVLHASETLLKKVS
jgi:heptosyltransferase-2